MRIQMDLQEKKVLVVGTGLSGIAAAELLAANGIAFDIFDGNAKLTEAEIRAKIRAEMEAEARAKAEGTQV